MAHLFRKGVLNAAFVLFSKNSAGALDVLQQGDIVTFCLLSNTGL